MATTSRRGVAAGGPRTNRAPRINPTTFHVYINPQFLRDGDVVTVRGSIAQLGEWNEPIPMIQDPGDPGIWSLTIEEMPFSYTQKSFAGLFHFKYCIENAGNNSLIYEGQNNRREDKLLAHYYHTFRQDYRNRRFAGYKYVNGLVLFSHALIRDYQNGVVPLDEMLLRFKFISLCNRGRRRDIETIFEDTLREMGDVMPIELTLAFLGMVGSYGLSSRDPLRYQTGGNNRNRQRGQTRLTRQTEPLRNWNWHVVQTLPVADLFSLNLTKAWGSQSTWVVKGMAEAVERIARSGSYEWLRIMPVVDKGRGNPQIRIGDYKNRTKNFNDAVPMIRALASDAMMDAEAEYAARTDSEEDKKLGEPLGAVLSRNWLALLVRHCPDLDSLIDLFDDDFRIHASLLVGAVADKVEDYSWRKKADLAKVESLLDVIPEFRCAQMGAALLKNDDADEYEDETLHLVALCTEGLPSIEGDNAEGLDEILVANIRELNNAAKDWFRSMHEHEPTRAGTTSSGGGGSGFGIYGAWVSGGTRRGRNRKPPSEEQLAKERLEAMMGGVASADALLQIPYFAECREQATLFELGRCHFFKGDSKKVLAALVSLSFEAFSLPTARWCSEKAVTLVTDAATAVVTSQTEIRRILSVVTSHLDRNLFLTHNLLHALLVAVSDPCRTDPSQPPSMVSVLKNDQIWADVFRWLGTDANEWAGFGALGTLLVAVADMLHTVAAAIADQSVTLRALHNVLRADTAFLALLDILSIALLDSSKLAVARAPLTDFDSTLEKVQCYVTFYCNCGVRIDADELRALVERLKGEYDRLTLATVARGPLTGIACLPHVDWLFSLRTSELFFTLWRNSGTEMIRKLAEAAAAAANNPETPEGVPEPPPMPGLGLFDDGEGSDEEPDETTDADIEFLMDSIVLDQDQVCTELIPLVQQMWHDLMDAVRESTIAIHDLERTFGSLTSGEEDCEKELQMLAASGDPAYAGHGDTSWTGGVYPSILDYMTLKRLCGWIPATLHITEVFQTLITAPATDDRFVSLLQDNLGIIQGEWDEQTLATVSTLVAPVKDIFAEFTRTQLDFLQILSESDDLVAWLLDHPSSDEFNKLLQVCRPCTDDHRLLSAIAALVQVRTLLLHVLYIDPPFVTAREFFESYRSVEFDGQSDIEHLQNVQANFEGLLEVFEKNTRSPGIKSLYDLQDMHRAGTFVLRSGMTNTNDSLYLEVAKTSAHAPVAAPAPVPVPVPAAGDGDDDGEAGLSVGIPNGGEAGADGGEGASTAAPPAIATPTNTGRIDIRPLEDLLDLRSKLMMTEIPEEFEFDDKSIDIQNLVEQFVLQLEILVEMKDALESLHDSGHFHFQDGYTWRYRFEVDGGHETLKASLAALHSEIVAWDETVAEARTEYFYLNFFSMREIKKLNEVLDGVANLPPETPTTPTDFPSAGFDDAVEEEIDDGTDFWVCDCAAENSLMSDRCAACTVARPTRYARKASRFARERAAAQKTGTEWACEACTFENSIELMACSMCGKARPANIVGGPVDTGGSSSSGASGAVRSEAASFQFRRRRTVSPDVLFTELLHLVSSHVAPEAIQSGYDLWNEDRVVQVNDSPESARESAAKILRRLGEVLSAIFDAVPTAYRTVRPPGEDALHRGDMLVTVSGETGSKALPIWAACAESPNHVIDVVFSVYVRRGRLPEPGEIVFCNPETTEEEIELVFRRFFHAKKHGCGNHVFCVADIHLLSYTKQCNVVEKLRELLALFGTTDSASLLFVSGKPRQVILNSLSSQAVELPPLEVEELARVCGEAFTMGNFETQAVASTINGGGKTHYILRSVAERQRDGFDVEYRRIPFRESSSAGTLLRHLSAIPRTRPQAFHINISHIIPVDANTILFQLLLVGVIRDIRTCSVYYRNPADIFLLEIPNSVKNKTAKSLRFASFLPTERLRVEGVDMYRPILTNAEGTQVSLPEYSEMVFVCKFLRAFQALKFKPGDLFDPEFNPWLDADITADECFALLCQYCAEKFSPSYLIFSNFINFMNMQFMRMMNYAVFSSAILQSMEGLGELRHVFTELLIETSRDFSLRSVPQVSGIGWDRTPTPRGGGMGFPAFPSTTDTGAPRQPATTPREANSVGFGEAMAANEVNPLLRENTVDAIGRFSQMTSWENSDHPVVLFYQSAYGTEVTGLDILSLNKEFADQYFHGNLKQALQHNGIDFNFDWAGLKNDQAIEMIRRVEGYIGATEENIDPGYVVTVDNLLKMISIQLRIKYNLPVIISGETGCGKSSLIRQLCAIIGTRLRTLNIHGGMEDRDITRWMRKQIREAEALTDPMDRVVVFFDEVNTCNCMGLFREMVCDRMFDGQQLPDKIKLIAACNPYRLKAGGGPEEMAGLVFEHAGDVAPNDENIGTGIHDPLSQLVYRVHPLPESMIDHVFDFGSLSPETERLYIKAILLRQVGVYIPQGMDLMHEEMSQEEQEALIRLQLQEAPAAVEQSALPFIQPKLTDFGEFVEVFAELICCSQEFVRGVHGDERSTVSLRDVARCVKVYRWFGEHFVSRSKSGVNLEDFFSVKKNARKEVRKAVILALAYCFHARLPRDERKQYRACVYEAWRALQRNNRGGGFWWLRRQKAKCSWLRLESTTFIQVLETTQRSFVSFMNLGEGIALNEALCENLFMMLVSVLNQIPIFVIGKPGSSKSLAMELIQSNLQGDASANEFLQSLPAVAVFSYQCSPLSTSAGIEQAFETARRYRREAPNTVVVVLLDEVGLAEQSPHLPLKVLHKVLDEGGAGEAVVGISNWALDPAKMNRAVHLYRPAPTVEDLSRTAEGMVKSVNLKGYLQSIAQAYSAVYHGQEREDFWGLREFYSTVRFINRSLAASPTLDAQILMDAVLRNFGGRPHEMPRIIATCFASLGMNPETAYRKNVVELVRDNLGEREARHLMLLTKNNAALGLLFDYHILSYNSTEVIYGSDFPDDQTDLQVCLNIQRVKNCMAEGITVVLVHCESLYESLYDLLNQHYTSYGGQLYVRLAFGTHSRLCPIHPAFRVVVIVEKLDAYTKLAPPLLNRFEKQVMERQHMLTPARKRVVDQLTDFVRGFVTDVVVSDMEADGSGHKSVGEAKAANLIMLRTAFCGYHSDILSSLALSVATEADFEAAVENGTINKLFQEAVSRLLWVAAPEATCKVLGSSRGRYLAEEFRVDAGELYFKDQYHNDLPGFVDSQLHRWRDDLGTRVAIMTYSPFTYAAASTMKEKSEWKSVHHVVLHELSSERDLIQKVKEFFDSAADGSVLLVQCDPLAASLRRIEHAKYVTENVRAKSFDRILARAAAAAPAPTPAAGGAGADAAAGASTSAGTGGDAPAAADESSDDGIEIEEASSSGPPGLERGVHVVFMVHLPRGSEVSYGFDFDMRWRYAFLDSLEPAADTGLPDVGDMLGKSVSTIMKDLDLRQVLKDNFRTSLARLVYLYERTNEDVRAQISHILTFLDDEGFHGAVHALINTMITEADFEVDVASLAQHERELMLAGTFRAALHRQITGTVSSMFAVVMGHMERNFNLALYEVDSLRSLWLYLFNKSFEDMNVFGLSPVANSIGKVQSADRGSRLIEVRADGVKGRPFQSQFPFSFFLARLLESFRGVCETAPDPVEALEQQFGLLNLEQGLDGELSSDLMDRYVHDFTCMYTYACNGVERADQARILGSLLARARGGTLNRIADVHATFWGMEKIIDAYFKLIDIVTNAATPLTAFLLNNSTELGPVMHGGVLDRVITALQPEEQPWTDVIHYGNWMAVVELCKPIVANLFDWSKAADGTLEAPAVPALEAWEKTIFFYTFVRDVAVPMSVPPQLSLETMHALSGVKLTTQEAYRILVRLLSDLNRQVSRKGQEMECNICYSIPTEPVRFCGLATCRRLVCRACLDDYMASPNYLNDGHRCFWCRTENAPGFVIDPQDAIDADWCRDKEGALRRAAGRFMEFYIFNYCFSASYAETLSVGLVRDFITILAGNKADFGGSADGGSDAYFIDVVPSDAGRVALLRALLALETPELAEAVQTILREELDAGRSSGGYLDTPLAVLVATVKEEPLADTVVDLASAVEALQGVDISVLREDSTAPIWDVLTNVAVIRSVLAVYGTELCGRLDDGEGNVADPELATLQQALEGLLCPEGAVAERSIERSMRMFLLKNMERTRGVAFVRSALQQEPLHSSQWLVTWKESGEPGLLRFLGSNKLPQHNPLKDEPLVGEVSAAMSAFLNTGDVGELDRVVGTHAEDRRVLSALLAVIFNEVYLLQVLPTADQGSLPEKVAALREWLSNARSLSWLSEGERFTLLFFCGQNSAATPEEEYFLISPSSSPERIIKVRAIVHVVMLALAAREGDLFYFMREMLFSPGHLKDTYFPTGAMDARYVAQQVLGGRWYACPNGHAYYVDKCGRPTQILQCHTCGVDIGGESHNLLNTNQDLEGVGEELYQKTEFKDQSEPNYIMRDAEQEAEDRYYAPRALNPMSTRVFRFFIHSAALVGAMVGGPVWEGEMQPVYNPSYADPENQPAFLFAHVTSAWDLIKTFLGGRSDDDTAMVLHLILASISTARTAPEGMTAPFTSTESRGQWEEHVHVEHISPLADTNGLAGRLTEAYARFGDGDEEGSVFTAELLEQFDVNAMSAGDRAMSWPALWSYRRPFSLDHMQLMLGLEDEDAYPILTELLTNEQSLRALRYLPGVFQFLELTYARFNRRIDRETARNTTIGDVLESIPEGEALVWRSAWEDWAAAWAAAFKFVKRDGCMVIPPMFAAIQMTEETPLSFMLPGERDECMLPVALTRYLTERHNALVETVDATLLMRGRELQRDATRDHVVASRFFTAANALNFDTEGEFVPYCEKQCVEYTAAGDALYDFEGAQTFLIENYFSGRPLVDLELKAMTFLNESGGAQSSLASLQSKIPQEDLPRDLQAAIVESLSSAAAAQRVIEVVETVVAFLQASTGSSMVRTLDVGDLLLADYIKTVLLMDVDGLPTAVRQHVRLCNLDSVYKLLLAETDVDPFASVEVRYKRDLEPEVAAAIRSASDTVPYDIVAPILRSHISAHLTESTTDDLASLKASLGWETHQDEFLQSAEYWAAFPDSILMRHAVSACLLMESLMQ